MKVRITMTLDIDPEAWGYEYGVDGDAEVRSSVREYAENDLRAQYGQMGLLLDGER